MGSNSPVPKCHGRHEEKGLYNEISNKNNASPNLVSYIAAV